MRIFHLVPRRTWADAVAAGEYRPPSLATEGFVHFSFAEQVTGTANLLYRDVADLIVVEVDADRLPAQVVVEGTFPHVYAPIPVSAAVAVHELRRDNIGDYAFSPGRAGGAASPDR
jgi:uncharacterized protein (DUF952 family)